jgi:enamine deaminase RidA (YjgF/YER057c/UK114 family)
MNEREIEAGLAQTPNYRYADRVGNRLFVAGQVPRDGTATLVGEGDPAAQARQCLQNLFTVVEHHGLSKNDIHQLTIYVAGPHQNLLDAWTEVVACFDMNVPPATLLGVTWLGYVGQLVEVDAVVVETVVDF